MTHCTNGVQGNSNDEKIDLSLATGGNAIITKHCTTLAIIHQHGYHPTIDIPIHYKVPFKWCKDHAANLTMTSFDTGSQPFLPLTMTSCDTGSQPFLQLSSSSPNVCDQTPDGALAMATQGSVDHPSYPEL